MSTTKATAFVNKIMDYEDGELSGNDTLELFAALIESGVVWSLQGSYGRTADQLIRAGYIDERGTILRWAGVE
jgi:hypothetical protein